MAGTASACTRSALHLRTAVRGNHFEENEAGVDAAPLTLPRVHRRGALFTSASLDFHPETGRVAGSFYNDDDAITMPTQGEQPELARAVSAAFRSSAWPQNIGRAVELPEGWPRRPPRGPF